jgi:hypothetical protein
MNAKKEVVAAGTDAETKLAVILGAPLGFVQQAEEMSHIKAEDVLAAIEAKNLTKNGIQEGLVSDTDIKHAIDLTKQGKTDQAALIEAAGRERSAMMDDMMEGLFDD